MTVSNSPAALPKKLIDVEAVAEKLQCSKRHVFRLADSGAMPAPLRLGNLVRWSESAIEEWIERGCPAVRSVTAKGGAR